MKPVLRVLSVALVLLGCSAEEPSGSQSAIYELVMEGAMFSDNNPAKSRELVVNAEQHGDLWEPLLCVSRSYNMAIHKGAVIASTATPQALTMEITTDLTPDKWIPGGQGRYSLTLQRPTPETLVGSFTGVFREKPVSGSIKGTCRRLQKAADHVPLAPQEHPRLLFRAADLPALRAKATTPFGKAAIARMQAERTPMSLAMLYQLTGDRAWADQALKESEEYLAGRKPGADPFVPKRPLWLRLEHLAMSYDLCHDTLPEDYKARYRSFISDMSFQVFFAPEALGTTNWHVQSNHVANVYAGILLNGLVLYDHASAKPVPPTAPFLDEVVPPAKDFIPAEGVPVVDFTPGKSPTDWLITAPLKQVTPDDPRAQFYGLESVAAKPGTQVKVGDYELTFARLDPALVSTAEIGGLKTAQYIPSDATAKGKQPLTMCAYAVLRCSGPGQYKVENPVSRANLSQISLNGRLLAHGQVVRLDAGLYPMMAMLQWRMKWADFAPRLVPVTDADLAAWKTQATALAQQHATRMAGYQAVLDGWKRTGGGDPVFQRMLRLGRWFMTLQARNALGRGGFQPEVGHYSYDGCLGGGKTWSAYRRVMGHDLTPDHEYPDFIPRKLVSGPQDINGYTGVEGDYFAALFPVIRKEWQPDVLTAWLNAMGATAVDPVKVLDMDPVRAFISYPLDMKPAPIGSRLPLAWQAPDFGFYALRSGWGPDAFVFQVFLKEMMIHGWKGGNAGTFRLRGLGTDWAGGPSDRFRARSQENVVTMPTLELEDGARGHLTDLAIGDGTLCLSANLDEIYETKELYEFSKYGHIRRPAHQPPAKPGVPPLAPSGITGQRSLAVDYTGLSGAPCLLVVVDRIDGGKGIPRSWLWQPPTPRDFKAIPGNAVTPLVNPIPQGFELRAPAGPASLRGIFSHPGGITVNTRGSSFKRPKSWGSSELITITVNSLNVESPDHFFFVATVTPGDHPVAQVQGTGLDAVVTVGKRTVRFDGRKIILGSR